jgi:hypothetical protein
MAPHCKYEYLSIYLYTSIHSSRYSGRLVPASGVVAVHSAPRVTVRDKAKQSRLDC